MTSCIVRRAARIVLALAPVVAGAQQPAAARPLSLRDAILLAERGNPALRQTANDVDVAEAQRRAAGGAYLPSLSFTMGFSGGGTRTAAGEDQFGQPIQGARRTFLSSTAQQGVSLNYTLWDGGARARRLGAARRDVVAAEADVLGRRAALHAEVASQYYRVRAAERRIALEVRLLAAAHEQLDAARRRFRIAAANREDVLGAEADVATAEARMETARGEARKAELVLRQQLGLDGEGPLALTDDIPRAARDTAAASADASADTTHSVDARRGAEPRLPADAPRDVDALVRVALDRHPSIAAAEARERAAFAGVGASRGARWPTVTANAGYSRSDRASDYGAFFEVDPRASQGYSFGLATSLPLFDRWTTGAQIAESEARLADAREAVRSERLRVEHEVRAAAIDVENARRGLRLAERAAALSRERVELARARYESGGLDFLQYQQVLQRAAETERQEAEAELALALAEVQRRLRSGEPVVGPAWP